MDRHDGHTEGQWSANGQVTQNGQTFNVYQHSGDASLRMLIDQHIAQVDTKAVTRINLYQRLGV